MKIEVGMKIKHIGNGNICTVIRQVTNGKWLVRWLDKADSGEFVSGEFTEEVLLRDIRSRQLIVIINGLEIIKKRHNL